ncbi:MAG TPA: hypothetical protein VN817_09150, partial [Solirubrobacteraceae bacterium]|nr:hypothetical protein [Solirubrobacteraceae bacterium]
MTDTGHVSAARRLGGMPARYSLGDAGLAAVLIAVVLVLVLDGGSSSTHGDKRVVTDARSSARPATTHAVNAANAVGKPSATGGVRSATSAGDGKRTNVAETADPQEA